MGGLCVESSGDDGVIIEDKKGELIWVKEKKKKTTRQMVDKPTWCEI